MCLHTSSRLSGSGKSSVKKQELLFVDVSLSRIRCCPPLSRCCRTAAPRSSWSVCKLSKSPKLAAATAAALPRATVVATSTASHVEVRVPETHLFIMCKQMELFREKSRGCSWIPFQYQNIFRLLFFGEWAFWQHNCDFFNYTGCKTSTFAQKLKFAKWFLAWQQPV